VVCIYDCYSPDGSTLQCSYYCECQWSDHGEDVVICTIFFHFACLVRVLLLIHIIFTWTSCWVEMLWRLTARHRHHLDMARPAKATSQNSPNKPNLRQHKRNQHTQKHNQKKQATLADPTRKRSGLLYTGPGTTWARLPDLLKMQQDRRTYIQTTYSDTDYIKTIYSRW